MPLDVVGGNRRHVDPHYCVTHDSAERLQSLRLTSEQLSTAAFVVRNDDQVHFQYDIQESVRAFLTHPECDFTRPGITRLWNRTQPQSADVLRSQLGPVRVRIQRPIFKVQGMLLQQFNE
jgi:hypothetical protein